MKHEFFTTTDLEEKGKSEYILVKQITKRSMLCRNSKTGEQRIFLSNGWVITSK